MSYINQELFNSMQDRIKQLESWLVDERANQIGWLTIDRGEMTWEDARKQLEAEGKL